MHFPAACLAGWPCYGCVSDVPAAVFTLIDAGTGGDGCRLKGVNEATQGSPNVYNNAGQAHMEFGTNFTEEGF